MKYLKTDKIVETKSVDKKNHEVKDPFVLEACTVKIAHFADMLNKQPIRSWSVVMSSPTLKVAQPMSVSQTMQDNTMQTYTTMDRSAMRGTMNLPTNIWNAMQVPTRSCSRNSHPSSSMDVKSLATTARAKEMYPVCVRQIFKHGLLDFNDYDNGIMRITTNPWLKVKIPKSDTPEKRAITMEECRAFFAAPLPPSDRTKPLAELGHDVAMMVLCLAGMNTVDIFNLKKENYHDGIIGYERAKTRKFRRDNAYIEMKVPGILQPIFNKYLDVSSRYAMAV